MTVDGTGSYLYVFYGNSVKERFLLQSSYPCKYYVLILVTTITG